MSQQFVLSCDFALASLNKKRSKAMATSTMSFTSIPASTKSLDTPTSEQYQARYKSLYSKFLEHLNDEEEDDEERDEEQASQFKESTIIQKQRGVENHSLVPQRAGALGDGETGDLSQQLQSLISNNSELGSRLLSLLLVSSGNAHEIIKAVNKGDLSGLKNLELTNTVSPSPTSSMATTAATTAATGVATSMATATTTATSTSTTAFQIPNLEDLPSSRTLSPTYTEEQLSEFRKIELEKRRKNSEASARFRIRKKQREREKLVKLKQLNTQISELYSKIDRLLDENCFWKQKLDELNEKKSRELLDSIKRRSTK